MKVFILFEQAYDDGTPVLVAAYTDKVSADTHCKLDHNLTCQEVELDGELPPHEHVTRYEGWVLADWESPEWKEVPCTIAPGGPRRGVVRKQAYCFWSYEGRDDVRTLISEHLAREDFDRKLDEFQIGLYGHLVEDH